MEKFKKLTVRLAKDESGMESVEVALSIALIAAIAGFGMIFLGEALANWYNSAGAAVNSGAAMPIQCDSTWVTTC